MSQKKKRNKAYSGVDAKHSTPTVHRYSAVQRGQLAQWYHDHRVMVRRIGLYGGGGALGLFLLIEAIRSLL